MNPESERAKAAILMNDINTAQPVRATTQRIDPPLVQVSTSKTTATGLKRPRAKPEPQHARRSTTTYTITKTDPTPLATSIVDEGDEDKLGKMHYVETFATPVERASSVGPQVCFSRHRSPVSQGVKDSTSVSANQNASRQPGTPDQLEGGKTVSGRKRGSQPGVPNAKKVAGMNKDGGQGGGDGKGKGHDRGGDGGSPSGGPPGGGPPGGGPPGGGPPGGGPPGGGAPDRRFGFHERDDGLKALAGLLGAMAYFFFGNYQGLLRVGVIFAMRRDFTFIHAHHIYGICGQQNFGAQGAVDNMKYANGRDRGWFQIYCGCGGADLRGNKRTNKEHNNPQSFEHRQNASLRRSCQLGLPVRLYRGHSAERAFAPEKGYRYDGLYLIVKCYMIKIGTLDTCRFLMVRADNEPAVRCVAADHPRDAAGNLKQGTELFHLAMELAQVETNLAVGIVYSMGQDPYWAYNTESMTYGWTRPAPIPR